MAESVRVVTESAEDTEGMARALAAALDPGDFLALDGTLGAGKTCFVRGLARGLGVPEGVPVTSPTFTLLNVYDARMAVHHLDFYRLVSFVDLEAIGLFDLDASAAVTVVEWASRIESALPSPRWCLVLSGSGERREIMVSGPGMAAERWLRLRESLRPWSPQP